jgi:hypothetical protein
MARSPAMIPWLRHTMVRIGRTRSSTLIRVTRVAGMRPYRFVLMCTLAAGGSGCTSSSPPTLTSAPASIETGAIAESGSGQPSSNQSSFERTIIVPGTPTDVYALVARGALGCWFASNGPLKATHVFRADAAPPSQGGQAEIVLYERDVSMRDQRGARAFQVKFANDAARVRVDMIVLRIGPPLAEPMLQDVEVWAGGGAGCQTRALSPPEAAAPLPPSAKTKTSRGGAR